MTDIDITAATGDGSTTIAYHGNMTGHCAQCHETFYGEGAFDRHQVHDRADGRPTCIPPSQYAPKPNGAAFWADHEGQWHYGQPMTAEEYHESVEAAASHMAKSRGAPDKSRPNTPQVLPVPTQGDSVSLDRHTAKYQIPEVSDTHGEGNQERTAP